VPTEPYIPNPPPQGGTLEETQRYLEDEFWRLAHAVRTTNVQAAYGALTQDAASIGTADIIPKPIDTWDGFLPDEPNRIEVAPDGQGLIVEEAGVYFMNAQLSAAINSGRFYTITVYKNLQPTELSFSWDTSNQTDVITETITGLGTLAQGDEISLWVSATVDGSTFDIVAAIFNLFRISELQKVA
jgi:hypothetical protein